MKTFLLFFLFFVVILFFAPSSSAFSAFGQNFFYLAAPDSDTISGENNQDTARTAPLDFRPWDIIAPPRKAPKEEEIERLKKAKKNNPLVLGRKKGREKNLPGDNLCSPFAKTPYLSEAGTSCRSLFFIRQNP